MSALDQTKMRRRLERELDLGYHGEPLRQVDLYRLTSDGVAHHVSPTWRGPWENLGGIVAVMNASPVADFKTVVEPFAVYKFMFLHGTRTFPGNGPFIQRVERGVS